MSTLKLDIKNMRGSPFYSVFIKQDDLFRQLKEGYLKQELTMEDLCYACFYIGIDFCNSYTAHVFQEMTNTALNLPTPSKEDHTKIKQEEINTTPDAQEPVDKNGEQFAPEDHHCEGGVCKFGGDGA